MVTLRQLISGRKEVPNTTQLCCRGFGYKIVKHNLSPSLGILINPLKCSHKLFGSFRFAL